MLAGKACQEVNGDALKVSSPVVARCVRNSASLVLIAAILSACGFSQITSPFRSKENSRGPVVAVSEAGLLEAARTDTTGQISIETAITGCPQFKIWPRDRLLTIYDIGREGDGLAIQYRGEITKTARECQIQPNQVTVKFGFAGRVLLGPRGRPGAVQMPIKVHVTDRGRNIVLTQKISIGVTIPSDNPVGYFSTVREISFTLAPGVPPGDYQLFVAFDRGTSGAG